MLNKLLSSWSQEESPLSPTASILKWVEERNRNLVVNIRPNRLSDSNFWLYDREQGCVTNRNHSFFTIQGMQSFREGELLLLALPLEPGAPFPLEALFCLGRVEQVEGTRCVVYAFREEEPAIF